MKINTNHVYHAFNREMDLLHAWLKRRVCDVFGYPASTIADRLTQLVTGMAIQPYTLAVNALSTKVQDGFFDAGTRLKAKGFSLEIGTGELSVSIQQWVRNQMVFFVHWSFCLLSIFRPKLGANNMQPAVLALSFGDQALFVDHSDEQFVGYCHEGPIGPLCNGKRFLIQTTLKDVSSVHPDFGYSRDPLITLLSETRMGITGRLVLLGSHATLFFVYILASIRMPLLSLLGKDFSYVAIAAELDRRGVMDAVVLSCASYIQQPLWMRRLRNAKTHMVWYAQNWKPHAYVSDNMVSDVPSLCWIRVDVHWVWTHAFAQYLESLNPSVLVEVVGPITWYLPEIKKPKRNEINIVIFDVSPFHDNVALQYGELSNYNHPDNLFAFLRGVLSLRIELEGMFAMPVTFTLKTKRGRNIHYDEAYFDYIEELEEMASIKLAHHSTNMYALISESHLVVAYPFTSPAYVAEYLEVPSIYYDPTGLLVRQDFCDSREMIDFANSYEGLLKASISALSKSFHMEKNNSNSYPVSGKA